LIRNNFPQFYPSLLIAPFILVSLIILVGFGNLIYLLNPRGGQPIKLEWAILKSKL